MTKKHKAKIVPPPQITVSTLVIDWETRTVTMNGRTTAAAPDVRYLHIPIISGNALVVPRSSQDVLR
jgi:hypothetical protein